MLNATNLMESDQFIDQTQGSFGVRHSFFRLWIVVNLFNRVRVVINEGLVFFFNLIIQWLILFERMRPEFMQILCFCKFLIIKFQKINSKTKYTYKCFILLNMGSSGLWIIIICWICCEICIIRIIQLRVVEVRLKIIIHHKLLLFFILKICFFYTGRIGDFDRIRSGALVDHIRVVRNQIADIVVHQIFADAIVRFEFGFLFELVQIHGGRQQLG